MERIMTIHNDRQRPWIVRIVCEGDAYGLNGCLVHEGQPVVEFFDATHQNDPRWLEFDAFNAKWGQFVSRYNVATLAATRPGLGLDLQGGVSEWQIDGATLEVVVAWAVHEVG